MPFEPFAISCSTCGAHLRVTNPALVGTIANCPKCGSLVQIAGSPDGDAGPPEVAGMTVGADPVDSEAITRDTVEPPETINSPTPGGGFAAPPEEPGTASRVPPSAIETSSPPAWQSARTERTRHIAMVVAIATCGLIVTSALFGWFVHSWNGRGQGLSIASVRDSAPAADDRDSAPAADDRDSATAADDSSEQHEPIPTSTEPEPARTETSEPTLPSSAEPTTTLDSTTLNSAMPDEGSVEPGEGKTGGTPDVAADRQAEAEGSTVSAPTRPARRRSPSISTTRTATALPAASIHRERSQARSTMTRTGCCRSRRARPQRRTRTPTTASYSPRPTRAARRRTSTTRWATSPRSRRRRVR